MTSFSSSISANGNSAQVLNPSSLTTLEDIWVVGGLVDNPLRVWLEIGNNLFSRFVDLTPGLVGLGFRDIFPRDRNYPPIVLNQPLFLKCDRPLVQGESLVANGFTSAGTSTSDGGGTSTTPQKRFFIKGGVTGDVSSTGSGNNIILFNSISEDSEAYDSSTGEVTVPYEGVYILSATILIKSNGMQENERLTMRLFVNGTSLGNTGYANYRAGYTGVSGLMQIAACDFLHLGANDKIALGILSPNRSMPINAGSWTRFGVWYLGN